MWIIFKLITIVILLANKLTGGKEGASSDAFDTYEFAGVTSYLSYKSVKGIILQTIIRIPLKRESGFKLKPESLIDNFFKLIGLSYELKVGNKEFDRKIYLETDAVELVTEIQSFPHVQGLIIELMDKGCKSLRANGKYIEARFNSTRKDNKENARLLASIASQLDNKPSSMYSLTSDPFFYKALFLEIIILGFAGYGVGEVIEFSFGANDWLIDTDVLMDQAIRYSTITILLFIPIVFLILRGSSRGHRLLLENLFYILIGFPLACWGLAKDINVHFDDKPSMIYETLIVKKSQIEIYRRGRNRIVSYVHFSEDFVTENEFPHDIKVSKKFFNKLNKLPAKCRMKIGRGRLKQRYIKGIYI